MIEIYQVMKYFEYNYGINPNCINIRLTFMKLFDSKMQLTSNGSQKWVSVQKNKKECDVLRGKEF